MSTLATDQERIYLDNAATSWPKLPEAVQAAYDFTISCGATSGRGSYRSATVAERWLSKARQHLASLIGVHDDRSIGFASSGTHALNAALCGVLREGDHVITTTAEHNSLLRPLEKMRGGLNLTVDVLPTDSQGRAWPDSAAGRLSQRPTWLAIGHSSNVTGAVTDLAAWSHFAAEHELHLLLDASQTLGYIPIDLSSTPVHVLVSAGHKGLRALAGTGFLYCEPSLQTDFEPLILGGTGSRSESLTSGCDWPDAVETGNLNLPGIVSLAVAAEHAQGSYEEWKKAFQLLWSLIGPLEAVEMVGADEDMSAALAENRRTPVLSLRSEGWSPQDMAAVLNDDFGIECRAGLHCAALIHDQLGTLADSGTLRLSPGHSTTTADVQKVADALRTLLG